MAIQPGSIQRTRPFCELMLHCEISAIISRIARLVAHFFTVLARFICSSHQKAIPTQPILIPTELIHGLKGLDKEDVIRAIEKIPLDKRDGVIKWVSKHLITSQPDNSKMESRFGRRRMILAVADLPVYERADIIRCALRLIPSEMSEFDRSFIIKAVAALPVDERADIIEYASDHLIIHGVDNNGKDIAKMIEALAVLPRQERGSVKQAFEQLIPSEMEKRQKLASGNGHLIKILVGLPAQKRGAIVQWAKKLVTPDMHGLDRGYILQAVAALADNKRDDIIPYALQYLITPLMKDKSQQVIIPKMDGYDVRSIIKVVAALPVDKRDDIIQYGFEHLITPEMSGAERADIIKAIATLSNPEREAIQKTFQRFIASGIQSVDGAVIRAIADIPVEERDLIVDLSLQLITDEMSNYQKNLVIETVATLPADKRADTVHYSLNLITSDMNGLDRQYIIEALGALPTEERGSVRKAFEKLITSKECKSKGNIFQTVATLPTKERESIVDLSLKIITEEMDGSEKSAIIDLIKELPKREREKILDCALEIITSTMDEDERNYIIKAVASLASGKRGSVCEYARKYLFTPEMDGYERARAIKSPP